MDFRSLSLACRRVSQGIGGRMGRPPGVFPDRRALMNVSAVHAPIPVSLSGVMFDAKLIPQGPAQPVMSLVNNPPQDFGPMAPSGIAGAFSDDGNPERSRFESNAGPLPVMNFGVWQSWHPPKVTRNFPRARAAGLGFDAGSFTTGGSAARAVATRQHASPETPMNFRNVFLSAPPVDVGPSTGQCCLISG